MAEQFIEYGYRGIINLSTIEVIVTNNAGFPEFTKDFSATNYTIESAIESVKFELDNFGTTDGGFTYPKSNPRPKEQNTNQTTVDLIQISGRTKTAEGESISQTPLMLYREGSRYSRRNIYYGTFTKLLRALLM